MTLSDSYVEPFIFITSHVKQNTQFENPDDPKLKSLTSQLRVVFLNERTTLASDPSNIDVETQENFSDKIDPELPHPEKMYSYNYRY